MAARPTEARQANIKLGEYAIMLTNRAQMMLIGLCRSLAAFTEHMASTAIVTGSCTSHVT